jgi:glycosyltransferase involved in cell wall biosynthesis
MRIGIDARFYGPTVGGGGLGRYTKELVDELQKLDSPHEFVLFLKKDNYHTCTITNPRFEKRLADVHWYGIREQVEMPRHIREAHVDFMHYPHWNIPLFARTPFIVTIHDLILLDDRRSARSSSHHPILHGFKFAAFRTVLETAVHASRHIVTVSNFSKQSILKHFSVPGKKISVIPNGIIPKSPYKATNLTTFGITRPFFLFLGNSYPHKNLSLLLDSFADFVKSNNDMQLVIAGKRDVFSRQLEEHAYSLGVPKEALIFLDTPPDDLVQQLYAETSLFVFPSRLEGFGMPPLEALQHGTPVASSSAGPLPEVLGTHADFFDPYDPAELTRLLHHHAGERKPMSAGSAAKKHLDQYTWEGHAKNVLELYNGFRKLRA